MMRSRAKRLLTIVALLLVSYSSPTLSQQNTDSRVFSISVVDEDGKPYAGLKPENFQVWVDKTPRKIISLTTETTPATVGILFDLSGSFGPPRKKESTAFRRKLSDALTRFLAVNNAENDYFVGTFGTRVAFSPTWTGPEESILENMDAPENYGQTAMYDALHHGIQNLMKSRHSRRVLLIISDGVDNQSKRTYKEVAELVKRSDVTIYAMAVYEQGTRGTALGAEGLEVLDDLAKLSGGRAVFLNSAATDEVVNNAFEIVADNLQSQYRLSIENEPVARRGKWHKLKLKLNLPDEKGQPKLDIWSRPGYYQ